MQLEIAYNHDIQVRVFLERPRALALRFKYSDDGTGFEAATITLFGEMRVGAALQNHQNNRKTLTNMAFLGKPKGPIQQFASPEELYLSNTLPRTKDAVDSLWVHQGDVIRAYADKHQNTSDLALELPTGTGKTLPGLLIGEWVRRKTAEPVIYATPTKQLARQVAATAEREGIPVAILIGTAKDWDDVEKASVWGAEAIGITTYSAIFNSSPKLPESQLLIFDDAHVGEQFVGNEYGISIRRHDDEKGYLDVLDALKPLLSESVIQQLKGKPEDSDKQVRLILPALKKEALTELEVALAGLTDSSSCSYSYKFAMIWSGLAACCVYLSYGHIQIRPMIPPTYKNSIFARAKQRIYLSATLGSGGELERAFGQCKIDQVPLPTKTAPRSGRRLFIFPDLIKDRDGVGLTSQIIGLTHKALVLSQETVDGAEEAAKNLVGDDVRVMGRDDLEHKGLKSFAEAPVGVLALSNRYDGLDLPDDDCRIIILNGMPDAVGLQERFLSERVHADAALAQRLRTRIVQGVGRCTRGPNDYAVVVVLGEDIVKYFARSKNRQALEPELQAEVEFGWENSKEADRDEVIENIKIFLEHGDDWRERGEPKMAEYRQDAVKAKLSETEALGKAAVLEVEAWQMAFKSDWIHASEKLQEAVLQINSDETKGYQGLLLYLAGVWLNLGAQDETQRSRARQLVRDAEQADANHYWIKEMPPLPNAEEIQLCLKDYEAVNKVVYRLRCHKPKTIKSKLDEMEKALAQKKANEYERGLTILGELLGADAWKPKDEGHCDSVWKWGTAMLIAIEAKSEGSSEGNLSLNNIRQSNTHLNLLAAELGEDPPVGSITIIVSDKSSVDPKQAQTADPNLYLTSTSVVKRIANDVSEVWKDLLATAVGIDPEEEQKRHVISVMKRNGCLPSQVTDQLTQNRINPSD